MNFATVQRRATFACIAICLCFTSAVAEDWQTVEVGSIGDLAIRIKHRIVASLSDDQWIGLEFINDGDKSIMIGNLNYSFRTEIYSLDRTTKISSSSLASGNGNAIFGKATRTKRAVGYLIPTGTFINLDQPSQYSSALLGLPEGEGVHVKASLFLNIEVHTFRASIEFDWIPPDQPGMAHLRERLNHMLRLPATTSFRADHAYMLSCLLKIPELTEGIPLEVFLKAIENRGRGFGGRESLAGYVLSGSYDREALVRFYLSQIKNQKSDACWDLRRTGFWDPSFLEPLVAMHEQSGCSPCGALEVLILHSDLWKDDPKITHRLSVVLLNIYGSIFFNKSPKEVIAAGQIRKFESFALNLAKTQDTDVLSILQPYLDFTEEVRIPWMDSVRITRAVPLPSRVCDIALDAILTILDGNVLLSYREMGYPPALDEKGQDVHFSTITEEQIRKWRDEMIVLLKKRLDAMPE